MKKLLALLFAILFVLACDDGEVIVTTFDFEDSELQVCGESGDYVFFKINSQVPESLSLQLSSAATIFEEQDTLTVNLDGSSNFASFRRFSETISNSYFCSNTPPATPQVNEEFFASSGSATLTTTVDLFDDDGLDASQEMSGDTDGDGIPDVYDFDDDGDNIPTSAELDNEDLDGDGNPLTNPKDTDSDGIPDYLDDDDDGDGVLTRNEDLDGDLNPGNDFALGATVANYLDPAVAEENIVEAYREHNYNLESDITVVLNNVVFIGGEEQITQETLNMGGITNVLTAVVTVTPVFTP